MDKEWNVTWPTPNKYQSDKNKELYVKYTSYLSNNNKLAVVCDKLGIATTRIYGKVTPIKAADSHKHHCFCENLKQKRGLGTWKNGDDSNVTLLFVGHYKW